MPVLLSLTVLVTSCRFYPIQPYRGLITCQPRQECQYQLQNGMTLAVRNMGFHLVGHASTAYVDCGVKNLTGSRQLLKTDQFFLVSAKGELYNAPVLPDTVGVKNDDSTIYVFRYNKTGKFTHKEFDNSLRSDTVYFIHTNGSVRDTLFKAVSDMIKRNYY